MQKYSLRHVENDVLLRDLSALVTQDRATTALLLAHIAEVKERKLFAPAGQPHMHAYCVNVLRFSEDVASKRLQAAGAARRFPVIFEAIADGRLHLSGVCLLAPHLLPTNAEVLISGAMGKTKAEIEKLLAEHFPQADLPESLQVIPVVSIAPQVVGIANAPSDPGQMEGAPAASTRDTEVPSDPDQMACDSTVPSDPNRLACHTAGSSDPDQMTSGVHGDTGAPPAAPPSVSKLKPLAPQRYGLQVTLDERTHDLLREAQDLLPHSEGGRQIANVLTRALELLVRHLKQRRFAETERPRRSALKPKSVRRIPASVKRAVRARDEGRCTFVNAAGERCPARSRLEYDHDKPVAKGGESTVANLRLRCRAHNQLAAEQAYGAEFMREKREKAKRTSEARKAARTPRQAPRGSGTTQEAIHERAYEVIPWLRQHSMPAPGAS